MGAAGAAELVCAIQQSEAAHHQAGLAGEGSGGDELVSKLFYSNLRHLGVHEHRFVPCGSALQLSATSFPSSLLSETSPILSVADSVFY